eukprot:639920-Rhodomonas_salina.1
MQTLSLRQKKPLDSEGLTRDEGSRCRSRRKPEKARREWVRRESHWQAATGGAVHAVGSEFNGIDDRAATPP